MEEVSTLWDLFPLGSSRASSAPALNYKPVLSISPAEEAVNKENWYHSESKQKFDPVTLEVVMNFTNQWWLAFLKNKRVCKERCGSFGSESVLTRKDSGQDAATNHNWMTHSAFFVSLLSELFELRWRGDRAKTCSIFNFSIQFQIVCEQGDELGPLQPSQQAQIYDLAFVILIFFFTHVRRLQRDSDPVKENFPLLSTIGLRRVSFGVVALVLWNSLTPYIRSARHGTDCVICLLQNTLAHICAS